MELLHTLAADFSLELTQVEKTVALLKDGNTISFDPEGKLKIIKKQTLTKKSWKIAFRLNLEVQRCLRHFGQCQKNAL